VGANYQQFGTLQQDAMSKSVRMMERHDGIASQMARRDAGLRGAKKTKPAMNWSKVIERLEREAAALERVAQATHHDPGYWKTMTVASVAATMAEALRAGME
jgi:hypothetical protein